MHFYLHTFSSLYFFRIVFDRETGKPKGFGFCEYRDAEAAQSAIRNLHGVDLNGRPLRVSIADPSLQPSEFAGGMTPVHIYLLSSSEEHY